MNYRSLAAGAAAFVVACSMAVTGFAADKVAQEEGKAAEEKAPVYSAKCPAPCNFSVRTHDKAEAVAVLKEHAKSHHQTELSDQDAEAKIKSSKK